MAIIHVDMDGITDDFNRAFVDKYNQRAKKLVSMSDITTWKLEECLPDEDAVKWAFAALDFPGWWRGIPLMTDDVPDTLERWNKTHEVYLLSSPWNALSCKEKMERVEEHFPFLGRKRLILAKAKHLVRGDLLIDDKPSNLATYAKHNPQARLATIHYPHHDADDVTPTGTFYAHNYANPEQAWKELDDFVTENL